MTKATDFNIRKSKWRALTVNISKQLSAPLTIDQIDFRVQSINKGGYATILAYKDARVDMHRLNEVLGPGRWQRKHEFINGQLFCSVGIWTEEGGWAWVQDVGTESNAEKEKGQASDSFKRACFNLGIGIELYDYPVIQVKLKGGGNENGSGVEWFLDATKKDKWGKPSVRPGWGLKLKEWVWCSEFEDGQLSFLAAKDATGLRFNWGIHSSKRGKE
jgi:hypothetical protein